MIPTLLSPGLQATLLGTRQLPKCGSQTSPVGSVPGSLLQCEFSVLTQDLLDPNPGVGRGHQPRVKQGLQVALMLAQVPDPWSWVPDWWRWAALGCRLSPGARSLWTSPLCRGGGAATGDPLRPCSSPLLRSSPKRPRQTAGPGPALWSPRTSLAEGRRWLGRAGFGDRG